jgi:hypothetical protein
VIECGFQRAARKLAERLRKQVRGGGSSHARIVAACASC